MRRYDVAITSVTVTRGADRVTADGAVRVSNEEREALVGFTAGYLMVPDPSAWDWDTRTESFGGQLVTLEHSDRLKRARITVDDYQPVEVKERIDHLLVYDGWTYQMGELPELANAVARDLERRHIEDESVLATFEVGRFIHEDAMATAARRSKFFFAAFFTNLYFEVATALNVGANNTITQD